jgi:hypothetical protein
VDARYSDFVRASSWLLVGLVLAGCSFEIPSETDSDVGGDGGDAPSSVLDSDNDSLVDAVDNCPLAANLDQRDHDADARGDVCDRCPHLPSTTDPDGDSDGVGDACDPRPAQSGDSIGMWEGFYDDSTAAQWPVAIDGTWTVGGGFFRQTKLQTFSFVGPTTMFTRGSATASFTLANASTSFTFQYNNQTYTAYPSVSVLSGVAGTSQSYACSVTRESQNRIAATSAFGGNRLGSMQNWSGMYATGNTITMTQSLGAMNHCDFAEGSATAADDELIGSTSGSVAFYVVASAVDIDYLFVVETGN